MKTLKFFTTGIIGILIVLIFSQCNSKVLWDPGLITNLYFNNQTQDDCYVDLILSDYLLKHYNIYFEEDKVPDSIPQTLSYKIEPNTCLAILKIRDINEMPYEIGKLVVKDSTNKIIYTQDPINEELWVEEHYEEGFYWYAEYTLNYNGQ